MPGNVQCFWIERQPVAEESLRRYVSFEASDRQKCPLPQGYHNASVVIGTVPWLDQECGGKGNNCPSNELKQDPRWPTQCACGYVFQPEDTWQHNIDEYYKRADGTGDLFTIRHAPSGAMWDVYWHPKRGPDGINLGVMLPDGVPWYVDWGSPDRQGWQRSGTVPNVTASPSIRSPKYHGFLRNGVLEPCSDSET